VPAAQHGEVKPLPTKCVRTRTSSPCPRPTAGREQYPCTEGGGRILRSLPRAETMAACGELRGRAPIRIRVSVYDWRIVYSGTWRDLSNARWRRTEFHTSRLTGTSARRCNASGLRLRRTASRRTSLPPSSISRGGSPKPVIPFLKRTGFLASDGTPTPLYKRFRNPSQSGPAAAEALRIGYRPLYDINEYVHNAKDDELRGVIVQATGADENSSTPKAIFGSFKALREFADFDATPDESVEEETASREVVDRGDGLPGGIRLGYTINLHLPATSDVAVFNAIFKSLREHLLR
jgi:hypothetical protein